MDYKEKIIALLNSEELSREQKEKLEVIFPELKESEDERIRKEILSLIRYTKGRRIGYKPRIHQDKMIAWLEKQGEKPRYNIGDVLCDKSCTTLNKDAQPNFEIIDIRDGMYICDKGSFPISQQDEYELVAKKIEQEPTNEEMIETLRTEYEKGRADVIAEMQIAWSKEDEKILRTIISDGIRGAEFDMVQVNWLKSLKDRYIWKPSDGQMKALHNLNLTGNLSYAGQGQVLVELYNDLLKLKA